jgi:hypothetical protein
MLLPSVFELQQMCTVAPIFEFKWGAVAARLILLFGLILVTVPASAIS